MYQYPAQKLYNEGRRTLSMPSLIIIEKHKLVHGNVAQAYICLQQDCIYNSYCLGSSPAKLYVRVTKRKQLI